jgi:arginyl-tRNA synthetase
MFELSQKFNKFYEECPVLKAESASLQKSRAALCLMTADTLKKSLGLLGIDTVEKL